MSSRKSSRGGAGGGGGGGGKKKGKKIPLKQVAGICDPFIFALDKFVFEAREAFTECHRLYHLQTELRDNCVSIETPEMRAVPSRLILTEFNRMISPYYKRIILQDDKAVVHEMHAQWQAEWAREFAGRETSEEAEKAKNGAVVDILYEKFQTLTSKTEDDGTPKDEEALKEDAADLKKLWDAWKKVCSTSETAALSMKMPGTVLKKAQEAEDGCYGADGEVDLDAAMKMGKKVKGSIKKKEKNAIKKLCKGRSKEEMTQMFGTTIEQAREMERLQKRQAMYRRRQARKAALARKEKKQAEKAAAFRASVMEDCPPAE